MNCPSCGAVVKEGRFCNYCGAKLPDDTKRIEISQHIENVAEMKRADYETEESRLRQKEMEIVLRQRKTKRISSVIFLVLAGVAFLIGITDLEAVGSTLLILIGGPCFLILLFHIIKQLVTGKW